MFLEAIFFAVEETFFRVSVQNFCHCTLHEIIGLLNFSFFFLQIIIQNYDVQYALVLTLFAPVLHFLHWCYT